MANEAANVEQRCAVLTMPSLSGDPLQGTEKAPGLAPAQPHLRKCRNGALNAPTATGAVITALPAKPNCWCAPQKPRTVRSHVVGQHKHISTPSASVLQKLVEVANEQSRLHAARLFPARSITASFFGWVFLAGGAENPPSSPRLGALALGQSKLPHKATLDRVSARGILAKGWMCLLDPGWPLVDVLPEILHKLMSDSWHRRKSEGSCCWVGLI